MSRPLAEGLKTTEEWIMGLTVLPIKGAIPVENLVRIPILGTVKGGYGSPAYEDIEGYEYADVREPPKTISFSA